MSVKKSKIQNALARLQNRPSILRSTAFHGTIRVISALIGWPLLIIGIGLIVAGLSGFSLLDVIDSQRKDISRHTDALLGFQILVGLPTLLLSLTFLFMTHLSKAIIVRNFYIIDLEEIIEKGKS